jgi:hypothetical protein
MYTDLQNLYIKEKSLTNFLIALNKKNNKDLLKKFNEYCKKTCYFYGCNKKLINWKHQAVYNLLNNIISIPTYSDGGLKIFKNFNEGYYTEDEYYKNIPPVYLTFIKDEQYIYPALKHLTVRTFKIFKKYSCCFCIKKTI